MIWQVEQDTRAVEGLDERGRAIPGYAASLGLLPARTGQRVLATACEVVLGVLLLLPAVVALPALILIASSADPGAALRTRGDVLLVIVLLAATWVLTAAYTVVQLVLHGRAGVTVGKLIAGVRSVNVRTLERPGFWRGAVVRYLVLWASFVVPIVGPVLVIMVSPLLDPEHRGRGWADLAGATWFVDVRRGLNPYDHKRMRIARKAAATDLDDVVVPLPSLATPAQDAGGRTPFPLARSTGGVLGAPRTAGAGPAAPATSGGAAPAPAATPVGTAPIAPVAVSSAAAPSAPPPAGASAAGPRAELVLDSGECIDVTPPGVLLGRAPARASGDGDLALIPLVDQTKSVSKTHLAILCVDGGFAVVDRHSSNGVAIVRNGAQIELVPGRPAVLADGDDLRFGDRHARVGIAGHL
ncbi:hypothetical protein GCM10022240_15820 [Microbacterium kribbense]|uniref:FHA domain-containing protein n=1 Tax=Microbacterium kribbense TaxID=433645 RepID=A0ABP7GFC4_9MICO